MHERNKWAFWTLALCGAAVIAAPSSLLLDTLGRYGRFVDGFEPPLLKPVRVRSLPHPGGGPGSDPDLEFVEFRLRESGAKEVRLVGDFNAWKDGSLKLSKRGRQDWELTLPLPRGRYRYLFLVDGRDRLDPKAPGEDWGDRRVSVREVR